METPATPRISVLFVDDDPMVLRSIARILQGAHFEVLTALGPGEALATLDARAVDVIVSDIDMPGMNGLELIRIARRDHPETFRMLLSGNATLEKALEAINEGEILRFFEKPFEPYLFREALEEITERIKRRRQEEALLVSRSRRDELYRWLESRHPGLTEIERTSDGDVPISVETLRRALSQHGGTVAHDLLADLPG